MLQSSSHGPKRVPKVPDHRNFHGFIGHIHHWAWVTAAASIWYQDVNSTELRHRAVDNRFAIFALGYISSDEVNPASSIQIVN